MTAYLKTTGLPYGNEWCAAFVSYCFAKLGYREPRTPWCPALFPKRQMVWKNGSATDTQAIQPGMVWGIHILAKKRIGHVGFVERVQGDWITTVEGNSRAPDGRAPNGVYRKRRSLRTIKAVADWL